MKRKKKRNRQLGSLTAEQKNSLKASALKAANSTQKAVANGTQRGLDYIADNPAKVIKGLGVAVAGFLLGRVTKRK